MVEMDAESRLVDFTDAAAAAAAAAATAAASPLPSPNHSPRAMEALSAKSSPGNEGTEVPVDHGLAVADGGAQCDKAQDAETNAEVQRMIGDIDESLDRALDSAAENLWSFASAFTGGVSSVVKGAPQKISRGMEPLDTFGRSLSAHISSLAQDDQALRSLTGAARSAAASVQRNAVAVESALLSGASTRAGERGNGDKANASVTGTTVNVQRQDGDAADRNAADSEVDRAERREFADKPADTNENQSGNADEGLRLRASLENELGVNMEIARAAETLQNSVGQVGQTVGGFLGSLWGGLDGSKSAQDSEERLAAAKIVPMTRLQLRIREVENTPDTFCEPARDKESFEKWSRGFMLEDYEKECIAVLERNASVVELYERTVPRVIEENTFWMRYFFAIHVLKNEEELRVNLLRRAAGSAAMGTEDEEGWDDDEEDWDDGDEGREGELVQGEVRTSKQEKRGEGAPGKGQETVEIGAAGAGDSSHSEGAQGPENDGAEVSTAGDGQGPSSAQLVSTAAGSSEINHDKQLQNEAALEEVRNNVATGAVRSGTTDTEAPVDTPASDSDDDWE